jgi:hypothetical protein
MTEQVWLAGELTDEESEMVSQVSSLLNYDVDRARIFVVALLEDVNDHYAAEQVNTILLGAENTNNPYLDNK